MRIDSCHWSPERILDVQRTNRPHIHDFATQCRRYYICTYHIPEPRHSNVNANTNCNPFHSYLNANKYQNAEP